MVQYFVEVVEVKIDIFVVILYLFHVFLIGLFLIVESLCKKTGVNYFRSWLTDQAMMNL